MPRQKNLHMLVDAWHCCISASMCMRMSICVFLRKLISAMTYPHAQPLKEYHAIVPGYQRRDPVMVMALVYMAIVRLMAKVVVSKRYLTRGW